MKKVDESEVQEKALPDSDCEVVEPDIECWDRGLLVHGLCCAEIVPAEVQGEAEGCILHSLEPADRGPAEGVRRDRKVRQDWDHQSFDETEIELLVEVTEPKQIPQGPPGLLDPAGDVGGVSMS
ncbi:hypothetical protein E2C01_056996 [Portunus trituberculatus]|uniref:Uncharacterized protein n=1 Tax=Portunus trituberculatus TaxID=210409 RepID=A0A5B7GZ63_PORTR|nr:hypothetical protein [Portunus trituberculatus]